MTVRSIVLPANPNEAAELIEILPGDTGAKIAELVLGEYTAVAVNDGITMWLNQDRRMIDPVFNRGAQLLWTIRHGANSDVLAGPAVLTGGADSDGLVLGLTDEQVVRVEAALGLMRVRIENTYEDGHESTRVVLISPPAAPEDSDDVEDWWDTEVFDQTGDGHGAEHPKLGSFHEATVISGPDPLVGKTYEWG